MKASGWLRTLAMLGLGGAIAWAVIDNGPLGRRAELASGYAARVVCACRWIGNRPFRQCLSDLEPGTEVVRLSEDTRGQRITATVPLVASRSARFLGAEFGCVLE